MYVLYLHLLITYDYIQDVHTNLTKNATRHAEMCAIDMLHAKNMLSLCSMTTVYVNVEPCIMCAAALMKVKVKAIFYGCANEKFGGCGSVGNLVEIMSKLDDALICPGRVTHF